MINYLIFGGKRSRDFGIYISGFGAFNAPSRDVEAISIPGRNGDLILDNGRFSNITVTYPAFIHRDFQRQAKAARDWLLASSGYQRLEDTYNPELFRLARFFGPMDFDTRFQNRGGEMTLAFDSKPQRFLKSGEQPLTLTAAAEIRNPTSYPALPLITIYGSGAGTLNVGGAVASISEIDEFLTLDCDIQDAYKGLQNKNATVSLDEFPELPAGACEVSFSGDIEKIEIIPRWWTI